MPTTQDPRNPRISKTWVRVKLPQQFKGNPFLFNLPTDLQQTLIHLGGMREKRMLNTSFLARRDLKTR